VVKETVPDELSKVKPPPALDPGKDQELEEKKRDAAVKLKKQEAIDRLLKEKARENQKFADVTSSPLSDSLQRRKAQLAVNGGGSEASNYALHIQRSVRKFYSIPETYRIKGDALTAQIKISISPTGAILVMEVENSSGETGFDQLVMDIIRKAEPLPAPPTELIGKQLLLSFNP
jgi:TolA protein